jgi:Zn finger protein HypA/HybF involved in hydrogenase expression
VNAIDREPEHLPRMPICPRCGVIAPTIKKACPICEQPFANPRETVRPARGHAWVAVRCSFQCRSCQFLSPLDELDIDGSVECAQCGQAQRFDVEAWRGALAFAHSVGDLAFPTPEGRLSHPAIWIGDDNPFSMVGHSEIFSEHRQSSVQMTDGLTVHRSLFIEAAPGHPVCGSCHAPVEAAPGPGGVEASCRKCGAGGTFGLPSGAEQYNDGLIGVVADAHRTDQRRARLETTADGPVSLKCPECAGALPATRDRVLKCSYCGTASLIPVQARLRDAGQVLTPDIWWLAFAGPSARRAELEEPPLPEEKEAKSKLEKLRAKSTDLELVPEQPGRYLPQVLMNLALPSAALAVAVVIYLLLKTIWPDLPNVLNP